MSRNNIGNAAERLLAFSESNTTYQAADIVTVPAKRYTDRNEAEAEIDMIFKRLPLMLALSCEIPEPGDYKALEVVGLPVLMTRGKGGAVHAFLNVCAHRWTPVAAEGHGKCAHSRFVCPFHGWTYALDGKLIGIADGAKFGQIDKSKYGLRRLPCEERHGMIFVCLSSDTEIDLAEYYGEVLEDYAKFNLKDWAYLGSSELDVANWKLSMTNFFESYHFATQHPQTVSLRWIPNLANYEAFGPNMRIGFAEHDIARLRDIPRDKWGEEEGRGFTFMRYFFPNVTGSIYPAGISVFMQAFPGTTPDTSRVVVLYISREKPDTDQACEKQIDELSAIREMTEAVLHKEDFATCIATQRGLESCAYQGLLYGCNERGPQYFHEWVDWYLRRDPEQSKPVLGTVDPSKVENAITDKFHRTSKD